MLLRRDDLVAAALSLVGVKWRWQGRDPATGLDCAGLVVATGRRAGLPCHEAAPRYSSAAAATPEILAGFLTSFLEPSRTPGGEPGDMLLLDIDGRPQHAAVMVAPGEVVHALPSYPRRVIRERLRNGGMTVAAAYSFRGVEA